MRSIDHRPTDPVGQAELALTVMRNPPSGALVADDGASVLAELRAWYPELIERFGAAVIMVAAVRVTGRLPRGCARCRAQQIAKVHRLPLPGSDAGTARLLGTSGCARCRSGADAPSPHGTAQTPATLRASAMLAAVPPEAPPGTWRLLREAVTRALNDDLSGFAALAEHSPPPRSRR